MVHLTIVKNPACPTSQRPTSEKIRMKFVYSDTPGVGIVVITALLLMQSIPLPPHSMMQFALTRSIRAYAFGSPTQQPSGAWYSYTESNGTQTPAALRLHSFFASTTDLHHPSRFQRPSDELHAVVGAYSTEDRNDRRRGRHAIRCIPEPWLAGWLTVICFQCAV